MKKWKMKNERFLRVDFNELFPFPWYLSQINIYFQLLVFLFNHLCEHSDKSTTVKNSFFISKAHIRSKYSSQNTDYTRSFLKKL